MFITREYFEPLPICLEPSRRVPDFSWCAKISQQKMEFGERFSMTTVPMPYIHWYQGVGVNVYYWLLMFTPTALLDRHVGEDSRCNSYKKARHAEDYCNKNFC